MNREKNIHEENFLKYQEIGKLHHPVKISETAAQSTGGLCLSDNSWRLVTLYIFVCSCSSCGLTGQRTK